MGKDRKFIKEDMHMTNKRIRNGMQDTQMKRTMSAAKIRKARIKKELLPKNQNQI